MYDDEDDELSQPIDSATRWSLLLALALGGFWGVFFLARRSSQFELSFQLLRIGYSVTPIVAGLSIICGIVALRRLRGRTFARRGLAVVGIAASAGALLAWLLFTIYINILR